MDYLQIYKEEFNKITLEIRSELIDDFKLARKKQKNFLKLFNGITQELFERDSLLKTEIKNNNLSSYHDLFINRKGEYNNSLSDDEVLSLIFENEIKDENEKLKNIDYVTLIKKIAKQQAVKLIHNHFSINNEYYKLVYSHEKYQYFFKPEFENVNFETSKEYLEMWKLEYGNSQTNQIITKQTKVKNSQDFNKEDIKYQAKIEAFSIKEKHFLLVVLFDSIGSNNLNNKESKKKYDDLPLSEYLRILALIKDIIPYEVYYKSIANVSIYTELKKKYNLINKNEEDVFVNELNRKLNDLNITKFQKFLFEFLK